MCDAALVCSEYIILLVSDGLFMSVMWLVCTGYLLGHLLDLDVMAIDLGRFGMGRLARIFIFGALVCTVPFGACSFSGIANAQEAGAKVVNKANSSAELNEALSRIDRLEAQISEMQSVIGALQTLVKKGVAIAPRRGVDNFSPANNGQNVQPQLQNNPQFQTEGWGADTEAAIESNRDEVAVTPNVKGADLPLDGRVPESRVTVNGQPARQLYDAGYNYLMASDYVSAEATFRSFLSNYPQDDLTGNAQYWLGETYFARGDFRKAASEFLKGYKTYKNSQKGPDNLLKLGMSMHRLGQSEAACQTYAELQVKYPSLPGHVGRRLGDEQIKAHCK